MTFGTTDLRESLREELVCEMEAQRLAEKAEIETRMRETVRRIEDEHSKIRREYEKEIFDLKSALAKNEQSGIARIANETETNEILSDCEIAASNCVKELQTSICNTVNALKGTHPELAKELHEYGSSVAVELQGSWQKLEKLARHNPLTPAQTPGGSPITPFSESHSSPLPAEERSPARDSLSRRTMTQQFRQEVRQEEPDKADDPDDYWVRIPQPKSTRSSKQ